MQINDQTWIAVLAVAVLATVSCGAGAPNPTLTTPPTAKSPTPPPAKTVDATVNFKGLRQDREVDYAKPKGGIRIVRLGGSVTFGDGVAREAPYEAWMQRNMGGRAYDDDVLNAGKPGRSLAKSAALLESELLKYEPSLVVVSVQKDEGACGLRRTVEGGARRLRRQGRAGGREGALDGVRAQENGNALAELIAGAPLICCATGPVSANP